MKFIQFKNFFLRKKYTLSIFSCVLLIYLIIPAPTFTEPTSTVIFSRENKLLGAKIANDEQWRFPLLDSVPNKFEYAIIAFEDQYFYYHPGFNPVSIFKAFIRNIKARSIKSGGSTISMQIVRLARKGKKRSIKEKLIELVLATKLEIKYTKNELLAQYASYAPFGGNVVGLEAASWRYYGRPPQNLTWAESATLAVLPNAPSLIYPGKNHNKLLLKRNRLLKKLRNNNTIDSLSYKLALIESLPQKPKALPNYSPHLLDRATNEYNGKRINTSINFHFQNLANQHLNNHVKQLIANEVYNAACIIIKNKTGEIITYVGNSDVSSEHSNQVDLVTAARSTGSILKPILFAGMLNDGEILPNMLVPDIPMYMEGFSPKNYSLQFDGAVSATMALSRSLNVPAVHMLSKYGISKFHNLLKKLHFTTITQAPEYYGLSLILGGAEATLWDLTRVYSGMARILTNTVANNYQYSTQDLSNHSYLLNNETNTAFVYNAPYFSAASIWSTFQALKEVNRPNNELGWKTFSSANQIAWKTGTSFGFRDAWAIGVSPEYTIGVWTGNADGEGRPGLTGVDAAAPLLFDLFDMLNPKGWFGEPFDEFKQAKVCHESGYLASINCNNIDTIGIPEKGMRTVPCPYHKTIHLDTTETYRVNASCENPENMVKKSWFVLPPAMEYYYKKRNPFYLSLPALKSDCLSTGNSKEMEFIYPKEATKMYIPIDNSGNKGEIVFEIAHRNSNAKLYWHLNNEYITTTTNYHQLGISPSIGHHKITVVDAKGNTINKAFEIVNK